MTKLGASCIAGVLLLGLAAFPAVAQTATLFVNGRPVLENREAEPGQLVVQVRALARTIGAIWQYDEATRALSWEGQPVSATLRTAPFVEAGAVWAPLGPLVDALGGSVVWDAASRTARASVPVRTEVWVADQGTNQIHLFDGETAREIERIDLDKVVSKPHMVVFDADRRFAYVANMGSANASAISAAERKLLATVATAQDAHAAIATPDGSRAFVANVASERLVEIVVDAAKRQFAAGRTLMLAGHPALADAAKFGNRRPICHAYTADGAHAYVTLGGGGLVVFDTKTLEIVKTFDRTEFGANGCGLALTADGRKMYATSGTFTAGEYYVFDTATHTLRKRAPTQGLDAHGVAFSPDQRLYYVVNRKSNSISVIDTTTDEVVRTIKDVGDSPDLLAISADGKRAYVTTRGPNPATGTHDLAGAKPGFAILDLESERVVGHVAVAQDAAKSDPHGIDVRYRPLRTQLK